MPSNTPTRKTINNAESIAPIHRSFLSALNNPENSVEEKTSLAFQFLELEEKKFSKIHTQELKRKHLRYKHLKKEFELIELFSTGLMSKEECNKLLNAAEHAYELIEKSPIITNHQSEYSPHSIGLQELNVRSLYQTQHQDKPAEFNQSVIKLENKKDGVEPGFKAKQIYDLLLFIYEQTSSREERWQLIQHYQANKECLYDKYKDHLPEHFAKMTYANITADNKVIPDSKDLQRSKTIQKIYKTPLIGSLAGRIAIDVFKEAKKNRFDKFDEQAVFEVLGNDVARAYGLPVQAQYLLYGEYPNGALQFILKALFIKDAKPLGPLAGGKNNDNYCVKPILLPLNDIVYLSDASIPNLAEYYALFAIQGDPDAINDGGNKLRLGNQLVGIDFGHAYKECIVESLSRDFHFVNPGFKNYTIFNDSVRSQFVRGLIRLAKLRGETIDDNILKSYGEDFHQAIASVEAGADEKIFDDYIKKMRELADEFPTDKIGKENRRCCQKIAKQIENITNKAIKARNDFIDKFKPYLSLSKQAVDLVENFEKIFAGPKNTSLRSSDETVLLNHLRIKNNFVEYCEFHINNEGLHTYTFHFEHHDDFTDDKAIPAVENFFHYLTYLKKNNHSELSIYAPKSKPHSIQIMFNPIDLEKISRQFSEEKIKDFYHHADYKLYWHYQEEDALISALAALTEFGIKANLSKNTQDENRYILCLELVDEKSSNPFLLNIIREQLKFFALEENNGKFMVTFAPEQIRNIRDKSIFAIDYKAKQEAEIEKQTQNFHIFKLQLHLENDPSLTLIRKENEFHFSIEDADKNPLFISLLKTKLASNDIRPITPDVNQYSLDAKQLTLLNKQLEEAYSDYQEKISRDLSDYQNIIKKITCDEKLTSHISFNLERQSNHFHFSISYTHCHIHFKEKLREKLNPFHLQKTNHHFDDILIKVDQLASLTQCLDSVYEEFQQFVTMMIKTHEEKISTSSPTSSPKSLPRSSQGNSPSFSPLQTRKNGPTLFKTLSGEQPNRFLQISCAEKVDDLSGKAFQQKRSTP